jgi:glycosyltransferase involved in cell wall biosynthesis
MGDGNGVRALTDRAMMKRILMVAFHFPPLAGSSGIQRTLRFVQHLPQFEWQPLVLSAQPRAYERTADDLQREVPANTIVRRTFAVDAARHLSFRGHYFAFLARPDRWISWRFDSVRQGMQMIRKFEPKLIWSTYPIATAHLIGAELHRRSGIPWVADFRDPMAQRGYPLDPVTWRQYEAIEKHALEHAVLSVFTTPSAARTYRQRYPSHSSRVVVVENGYDEESFAVAVATKPTLGPLTPGATTLLHSGIVYPAERDPTQLMAALQRLRASDIIRPTRFRIRFRGAVLDETLHSLARQHGVDDLIETLPPLPYRDALHEMRRADGLLVMQASSCNEQIPGKLYEYLRATRPIICLSDVAGDTVGLMRRAGVDTIAPLDSVDAIARLVPRFLEQMGSGCAPLPEPAFVANASRLSRTQQLAHLLDDCVA